MLLFAREKTILEKESAYHHILVTEEAGVRYLKFGNNIVQSAVYIDDPYNLKLDYTKYLSLGLLFNTKASSLLTIGLGAGALPKCLHEYFPELNIEAVEIDGAVVDIAKKYFFLDENPGFKITIMDGRVYLLKNKKKFDIIILDAYNSDSIPFHLTTMEFLQTAQLRLNHGGTLVSNVWKTDEKLFLAMLKTFKRVFKYVYCFNVWGKNNVIIAAGNQSISKFELINRAVSIQQTRGIPWDLAFCAGQIDPISPNTDKAILLTDDFAPVDWLQHTDKK